MAQAILETMKDQMHFDNGKLLVGNVRYTLLPSEFFQQLQIGLENILGVEGTYAVVENALRSMAPPDDLVQSVKDLPFDQIATVLVDIISASGLGQIELLGGNEDPFLMKFRVNETYLEDVYGGKADGVRCVFWSSIIPLVEALQKSRGFDGNLTLEETKCVAKGDDSCEFTIT